MKLFINDDFLAEVSEEKYDETIEAYHSQKDITDGYEEWIGEGILTTEWGEIPVKAIYLVDEEEAISVDSRRDIDWKKALNNGFFDVDSEEIECEKYEFLISKIS